MKITKELLELLQRQDKNIKTGEVILLQTDFIKNLNNIIDDYPTANLDNDNWEPYVLIEIKHIEGKYYFCKLIPSSEKENSIWPFNTLEITISENGETKPYILDLSNRIIVNEFNTRYKLENKLVFFSCLDHSQENRFENKLRSIILNNWKKDNSKIINEIYEVLSKPNKVKNDLQKNWIKKNKNNKIEQETEMLKNKNQSKKVLFSNEDSPYKKELTTYLETQKQQYNNEELFKVFKKHIANTEHIKDSTHPEFIEFLNSENMELTPLKRKTTEITEDKPCKRNKTKQSFSL